MIKPITNNENKKEKVNFYALGDEGQRGEGQGDEGHGDEGQRGEGQCDTDCMSLGESAGLSI